MSLKGSGAGHRTCLAASCSADLNSVFAEIWYTCLLLKPFLWEKLLPKPGPTRRISRVLHPRLSEFFSTDTCYDLRLQPCEKCCFVIQGRVNNCVCRHVYVCLLQHLLCLSFMCPSVGSQGNSDSSPSCIINKIPHKLHQIPQIWSQGSNYNGWTDCFLCSSWEVYSQANLKIKQPPCFLGILLASQCCSD